MCVVCLLCVVLGAFSVCGVLIVWGVGCVLCVYVCGVFSVFVYCV